MEYEGQICRPPMERSSYMPSCSGRLLLQSLYLLHAVQAPSLQTPAIEQVEQELKRVTARGNLVQILGVTATPSAWKPDHLSVHPGLIHRYFPGCRMVNMDATVTNINQKSDEELRLLYDQGVRLYLGMKAGWTMCFPLPRRTTTSNRRTVKSNG